MSGVNELKLEYRNVTDLRAYQRNARTHPPKQIEQLAAAIKEFGFTNPILISDAGEIIAGHGRFEAAKLLELAQVPTICLSGLTDPQRRALVLADNRIAESSGWNKELLSLELTDLHGADYVLALTGFSDRELGEMLQPGARGGNTHPDDAPALPADPVSAIGDVWILGDHKVTCGDCCDAAAYARVLGGGTSRPLLDRSAI